MFEHNRSRLILSQSDPSLGWSRRTHADEPGAKAVANWLGITISAYWLLADDLG